jgi:hypothetical protein
MGIKIEFPIFDRPDTPGLIAVVAISFAVSAIISIFFLGGLLRLIWPYVIPALIVFWETVGLFGCLGLGYLSIILIWLAFGHVKISYERNVI